MGLEAIVGLEKMTIHQCQELAKKMDHDGGTFDLCGPKGKLPCKWLDAYMGIFIIDGADGFSIVSQFQFQPNLWCENLQFGMSDAAPEADKSKPTV